jgi:hypothetical protein
MLQSKLKPGLMPVILATQEAEIRRIVLANSSPDPISKKNPS